MLNRRWEGSRPGLDPPNAAPPNGAPAVSAISNSTTIRRPTASTRATCGRRGRSLMFKVGVRVIMGPCLALVVGGAMRMAEHLAATNGVGSTQWRGTSPTPLIAPSVASQPHGVLRPKPGRGSPFAGDAVVPASCGVRSSAPDTQSSCNLSRWQALRIKALWRPSRRPDRSGWTRSGNPSR